MVGWLGSIGWVGLVGWMGLGWVGDGWGWLGMVGVGVGMGWVWLGGELVGWVGLAGWLVAIGWLGGFGMVWDGNPYQIDQGCNMASRMLLVGIRTWSFLFV